MDGGILMAFCRDCGMELVDNARFCPECGTEIKETATINVEEKQMKRKDPWAAVLLNLLIAGLGMVYLGRYAKAVLSFIIVWITGIISVLLFNNVFIVAIVGYILIMAWSYDETKKVNMERGYQ